MIMNLKINGNKTELPDGISTVADLLKHYELDNKVMIVELNAGIVDKNKHNETTIQEGDQVELVHFVGGG